MKLNSAGHKTVEKAYILLEQVFFETEERYVSGNLQKIFFETLNVSNGKMSTGLLKTQGNEPDEYLKFKHTESILSLSILSKPMLGLTMEKIIFKETTRCKKKKTHTHFALKSVQPKTQLQLKSSSTITYPIHDTIHISIVLEKTHVRNLTCTKYRLVT
jgi:hypothetical protein